MEKFPIQAVGDNIIIDPLPEVENKGSDLIIINKAKLNSDFNVRPEGQIVSKGERVNDYAIGDKVIYREATRTAYFVGDKVYFIINLGNIMARLPHDYELQQPVPVIDKKVQRIN